MLTNLPDRWRQGRRAAAVVFALALIASSGAAHAFQPAGLRPVAYAPAWRYPAAWRVPPYYPPAALRRPFAAPGGRAGRPRIAPPQAPSTVSSLVGGGTPPWVLPQAAAQGGPQPGKAGSGGVDDLSAEAGDDGGWPLYGDEGVPRVEVRRLGELPVVEDELPQEETRDAFLRVLLPLVLLENEVLHGLRREIGALLERLGRDGELGAEQGERLRSLARHYQVEGDPVESEPSRQMLWRRVDEIPVSLALAQAVTESGWGRSRFAREGQNLFGIWTYHETEGMVPRDREHGKKHLVRRFDSLRESVRYYMYTLNSHPAYRDFRRLRASQRSKGKPLDGLRLAEGLERYSARGKEYVRIIRKTIERHNLAALDLRRLGV